MFLSCNQEVDVQITEDMSRTVRESRQELRRFMREVRRANPASVCNLQYDTLYVDKKCYKYNPVEGRVLEHTAAPVSVTSCHIMSHHVTSLTQLLMSRTPMVTAVQEEMAEDPHWAGPRLTLAPDWA